MSIFQNILSDYKYLESIKISHDLLINQASNDEWSFSSIETHPDGDGICEYSTKLDHRHRGLKKLYILKNTQTSQNIAVGAGCYKKIMGKTTKMKLPTIYQWENAQKSLKDFDEKYMILEQKLQKFISDELPSLEHYAKKYKISFDKAAFLEEIKNPEMVGYAIARINSLKHDISEYEKLKKIEDNKSYILKIASTNVEKKISIIEKQKNDFDEKKKIIKERRKEAKRIKREKKINSITKEKALELYLPQLLKDDNLSEVIKKLRRSGWGKKESKRIVRDFRKKNKLIF